MPCWLHVTPAKQERHRLRRPGTTPAASSEVRNPGGGVLGRGKPNGERRALKQHDDLAAIRVQAPRESERSSRTARLQNFGGNARDH